MNINAKLKEIVDKRGLKQTYICEKTGMTSDCVSRILSSTRKITAEEFLLICDVLDIDANEFRKSA